MEQGQGDRVQRDGVQHDRVLGDGVQHDRELGGGVQGGKVQGGEGRHDGGPLVHEYRGSYEGPCSAHKGILLYHNQPYSRIHK